MRDLSAWILILEGHAQRHYVGTCVRGRASIWSMQVENGSGRHRVLTIDVDPVTPGLCQIRGIAIGSLAKEAKSSGSLDTEARQRAGLSQEELSFRAEVDRSYISQLERDLKSPTVDMLLRLCRAMGASATKIISQIE